MIQFRSQSLTVLALTATLGIGIAFAGPNDGHPRHHGMGPDMEKIDLSVLADGERREFGKDEHKLSAQRVGDVVTITMPARDKEPAHTFDCNVKEQKCIVMLGGGEGRHKMIVIKKGGDSEEIEADVRVLKGDGDEEMTWVSGGEGANTMIFAGEGIPEGVHMMHMNHGDKIMKRCPEGDATMLLDKTEADVEYRCPKHNNLLEKVDRPMPRMMRREIVIKDGDKKESSEK